MNGTDLNFSDNGLIAQLSPADQALLLSCCESTQLKVGEVLSEPQSAHRQVYFLTSASVALYVRNSASSGLALGLAGHEGAVGLQFAFGLGAGSFTLLVQSSGTAWRVDGIELQRLVGRRAAMLLAFSRYTWSVAQEVASLAACAQVQDIKARLAGWLLMSSLRSKQPELNLTHAHLADMLGVRRAGVTLAAIELKELGLLDYQRGRIRILDQERLEALSCWTPERQPTA
jgi:CRP-like cAMP-binding protein